MAMSTAAATPTKAAAVIIRWLSPRAQDHCNHGRR
jgi:hypothetical protein